MQNNKLPFWRVALYSSASAGLNIIDITISTWLLYFYSLPLDAGRPTYLPAVTMIVLLLVAMVWDAIIDPIIFIGDTPEEMRANLNLESIP